MPIKDRIPTCAQCHSHHLNVLTGREFMADLHIVGQPTVSEVINLDSRTDGAAVRP